MEDQSLKVGGAGTGGYNGPKETGCFPFGGYRLGHIQT